MWEMCLFMKKSTTATSLFHHFLNFLVYFYFFFVRSVVRPPYRRVCAAVETHGNVCVSALQTARVILKLWPLNCCLVVVAQLAWGTKSGISPPSPDPHFTQPPLNFDLKYSRVRICRRRRSSSELWCEHGVSLWSHPEPEAQPALFTAQKPRLSQNNVHFCLNAWPLTSEPQGCSSEHPQLLSQTVKREQSGLLDIWNTTGVLTPKQPSHVTIGCARN